jgi:uncharacterized membrane protein YkvA (DUF1232 family)
MDKVGLRGCLKTHRTLARSEARRIVLIARAIEVWKQRARQLKTETYAICLAYRDPRTPWYARIFAACVVGYAFSPIDLVPDPIPVLGYLDDLVLVPLGIALALKMIPQAVLSECREEAQAAMSQGKPTNWTAAGVIIAIWLLLAVLAIILIIRTVKG